MKKSLISFISAACIFIVLSNVTFAQTQKTGFKINTTHNASSTTIIKATATAEDLRLNDVNIRALRNFIKNYKEITGLHWYTVDDGFIAKFTADGIETKVEYDTRGFWAGTIKTLSDATMPSGVRDLVKNNYHDFNILVAYEVETPAALIYIIKIENSTKLKTLKILEGEIFVIGDYVKE